MKEVLRISMIHVLLCLTIFSGAQAQTLSNKSCGPGAFLRGSECVFCPPGTFQNGTNAESCHLCPAGFYIEVSGAQGLDLCQPCPQGTFSTTLGATSASACKPCPSGLVSLSGSSKCIACRPGTAITKCDFGDMGPVPEGIIGTWCKGCCECPTVPQELKCRDCWPRRFAERKNSFECEPCKSGFTAEEGMPKCKKCPAGTSPGNGVKCYPCSRGYFNDQKIMECRRCPPGHVPNRQMGATGCVPCPEGTKQDENDFMSCVSCPDNGNRGIIGGSFCAPPNTPCADIFFRNKQNACQRCTTFERLDRLKMECVSCGPNEVSQGGLSEVCNACPRGTFVGESSAISFSGQAGCECVPGWTRSRSPPYGCEPCPAGTHTKDGQFFGGGPCENCPEGTFSSPGMNKCLPCPARTVASEGQGKCTSCPKGMVPQQPSSGRCVDPRTNCPPGFSRSTSQGPYGAGGSIISFRKCTPISISACPDETFGIIDPDTKEIRCRKCYNNSRFDERKRACVPCDKGYYSKGGLVTTCTKCSSNSPSESDCCRLSPGSIDPKRCYPCPSGTFFNRNEDRCNDCPAGTFGAPRARKCEFCPAGTFSAAGAEKCTPCPAGSTTFGVGESNCVIIGSDR